MAAKQKKRAVILAAAALVTGGIAYAGIRSGDQEAQSDVRPVTWETGGGSHYAPVDPSPLPPAPSKEQGYWKVGKSEADLFRIYARRNGVPSWVLASSDFRYKKMGEVACDGLQQFPDLMSSILPDMWADQLGMTDHQGKAFVDALVRAYCPEV